MLSTILYLVISYNSTGAATVVLSTPDEVRCITVAQRLSRVPGARVVCQAAGGAK